MPIITPRFRLVAHRLLSLLVLSCLMAPLLTPLPVRAAPNTRIVYAKADAPDGNSGDSWATARSLRNAMDQSLPGDEIWVAEGVHKPFPFQFLPFKLKSGVAVYGGFTGSEMSREERNPATHVTVLSGDLDNNDTHKTPTGVIPRSAYITGSNSFVVVFADSPDSTTVLDGFTITGGNATTPGDCTDCGGGLKMVNGNATLANLNFVGNKASTSGGGIYLNNSSPQMTAITFIGNQAGDGGGMYLYNSSPQMTGIIFTSNQADGEGGGMYAEDGSDATLMNVTFSANQTSGSGGGLVADSSDPSLTNVAFRGNRAGKDGGGMETYFDSPILIDVVFSGNQATARGGGGMGNYHSAPVLRNVTFSGNRAGAAGGGMFNENLSYPTLGNVIFSGNTADYGGGMNNDNSGPVLTNVTFSRNEATITGGGLYGNGSVTMGQNIVMWNNTPNNFSLYGGSFSRPYSLIDINPLFVRDGNCGGDGCTDDPATPNDDESANDDYGDLRLQIDSPAVDAGDNNADLNGDAPGTATIASIPNDVAGQPRIVAVKALPPTVDMGAYEHVSTPSAAAGGPYMVNEGSSQALNGASSSDDVGVVAYAWDCNADGIVDSSAPIATGSSCTYPNDGSYTLRLTVTDNVSNTGSATTTVTVANVAPTYAPAPNQSTAAGSAKLFTLGSFADPGAEGSWPVTVDWGDNSPLTQFSANAVGSLPGKSHTYAAPGSYNVVVTVNDGKANGDGGFEVTVNPLPPGAPTVTPPADQTATAGIDQSFALGSFVDPGSSAPWQVSINWGDSSTATLFNAMSGGDLPAKPHIYAAAGAYDVIVTVSDGGLASSASFRITVSLGASDAGSVTGIVFADANANGAQEAGELGVGGAEMTLATVGEASAAGADLTRTTTSDGNGQYRFDNVAAGDYTLTVTPPAGFATAGASQAPVSVQSGKTTTAPTFALKVDQGGSVTGIVFADANANGTQEADELGVSGAELTLATVGEASAAGAELTRTTPTDANGQYRFDNVPAGDYTLTVTPPAGFATTGAGQAPVSVQSGETTTAPTFALKVDQGGTQGSIFLPAVQRP